MTPRELKVSLLANLNHAHGTFRNIQALTGTGHELQQRRRWMVSEGLFINAWSHWESFLQELLIADLARDGEGTVVSIAGAGPSLEMRKKLAAYILNHPDHPKGSVHWKFDNAKKRAREHLSADNRFTNRIPRHGELEILRKIRNAIAHRNEGARRSFEELVEEPPFSLDTQQRERISVGEILTENLWTVETGEGERNDRVFVESIRIFEENARALVP